jgi:dipeptidyl aminopeptidase/acylaminoacyl peptidase
MPPRLSVLTFGTLILAALNLPAPASAQDSSDFEFTIANIMRGSEVYGEPPRNVQWSADSRWIYFRWNEPGTDWREQARQYRVRAQAGARPELVPDSTMDSLAPLLASRRYTKDRRLAAVESNGDIYLLDARRGTARRLTNTVSSERDPHFDSDERRLFFIRDDNVFAVELDGGEITQLTDIRSGPAPAEDKKPKGYLAALEAQQSELFEVVRDEIRQDSIQKAEREKRQAKRIETLYLQKGERVSELSVSPAGNALLILTTMNATDSRPTLVPRWVTSSGFTEEIRGREKVGDIQDSGRVAFMSLPSGDVRWLDVLPESDAAPAMVNSLGWNDAGTRALLFTVEPEWNHRYIQSVSADSGKLRTIDTLDDTAWVGGPCFGCGGWTPGGKAWFVSEADGYAQLYTVGADGGDRKQLTSGKWEVLDAAVSPDGKEFWLTTNEGSPFEQHFYRMPISGGDRVRITREVGSHEVTVSPDGSLMADVFSASNRPPELYVAPFKPGQDMARLTTSPTKAWLSFGWIKPAIVMVPASDGVEVPARIYKPQDMGATPNGAAVLFVHGAGYLHNVHNYWSSYSREYMFNQFLASKGYVVLDMDYRGSAGYGRDWRTAIYRHMGGRDLQDEVDGARYLQKEFGVDPERIGMYGGSYGGFMTLMALFTEPEWFGAGAALRSVTDWAHYNHWYTSRILNLPEKDTTAYRQSSPIYFADGLEDPLLMAHGMVDTNVEFQDIVRLSQRLIELGKQDWQLAVYPVENHGFVRPSSWTDEYRRIFDLFQTTIGTAAGPRSTR